MAVLGLFGAPSVSADTPSFKVQFAGCNEFVGWGPVSLAAAEPLLPAGYVIAGATNGQAAIVVRATSCEGVSVEKSPAEATELSQIGINIVAPDGTGDINNYTIIHVTNNRALARHFQTAGLPAVLVWRRFGFGAQEKIRRQIRPGRRDVELT